MKAKVVEQLSWVATFAFIVCSVLLAFTFVGCEKDSKVNQSDLIGSWSVIKIETAQSTILHPETTKYNQRVFYIDSLGQLMASHTGTINTYIYLDDYRIDEMFYNPVSQFYQVSSWDVISFSKRRMTLKNQVNPLREWVFVKE